MPVFPRPSSPRAAIGDLFSFMRQRSREQVIGASLAVLATIIIVILFFVDPQINTAPPQQIVYVEAYKPGRTDADIKSSQKKDQADREAFRQAKMKQFQKLEKAFGM